MTIRGYDLRYLHPRLQNHLYFVNSLNTVYDSENMVNTWRLAKDIAMYSPKPLFLLYCDGGDIEHHFTFGLECGVAVFSVARKADRTYELDNWYLQLKQRGDERHCATSKNPAYLRKIAAEKMADITACAEKQFLEDFHTPVDFAIENLKKKHAIDRNHYGQISHRLLEAVLLNDPITNDSDLRSEYDTLMSRAVSSRETRAKYEESLTDFYRNPKWVLYKHPRTPNKVIGIGLAQYRRGEKVVDWILKPTLYNQVEDFHLAHPEYVDSIEVSRMYHRQYMETHFNENERPLIDDTSGIPRGDYFYPEIDAVAYYRSSAPAYAQYLVLDMACASAGAPAEAPPSAS